MAKFYRTSSSQRKGILNHAYGKHGMKTKDVEAVLDTLHDHDGMTKAEFDRRVEAVKKDGTGSIQDEHFDTVVDAINEHVYGHKKEE